MFEASRDVGLKIYAEKTKCMLLARHRNVGQNHYIKIANSLFKGVSQFKYLGTTASNQNFIQKELRD
jgi:ERCC4-related helicase